MALIQNGIGPFEKGYNWTNYVERFKFFVCANEIHEDRVKALFLSTVGMYMFDIIKDLMQPNDITSDTVTFDDITDTVTKHVEPPPSVIVSRYIFDTREKGPNETVADFVKSLRHLSELCHFGANLEERLRDRLVAGVKDPTMVKRLLSEGDSLTFKAANEICILLEKTNQDTKRLLNNQTDVTVKKIREETREKAKQSSFKQRTFLSVQKECYRCNLKNHSPNECFYKDKDCKFCGLKGHIERACRKKKQTTDQRSIKSGKPQEKGKVKHVTKIEETESEKVTYDLMNIKSVTSTKPIVVQLELNGCETKMEIDTGACCSIITDTTFKKLRKYQENLILRSSNTKLRAYDGHEIKVIGETSIPVTHNGQTLKLSAKVVKGHSDLLGRDWLKHIRLNWEEIFHITNSPIEKWKDEYPEVFQDKLGDYRGPPARIELKEGTKPVFLRERQVPLALQAKVKAEIERLVKEDVLEPVEYSEWATPIVPVVKPSGKIRICGDYRMTVNKYTKQQHYPIPRTEYLIAKMAGGKIFSKIDMSEAYAQLRLDEESQNMCTINTEHGLFKQKRLPYGISSAPSIFQRIMEKMLGNIPHVAVYLDDVLVTGKSKQEHDETLNQVLQKFENANLRVGQDKCEIGREKVSFLGLIVDAKGVSPTEAKLKAVQEIPAPKSVTELRSFLGLINYYHRFVPNIATILEPLHELLRKNQTWHWTEKQENSFKKIKSILQSPTVLTHFDPEKPLILAHDASSVGVGAVLSQVMENGEEKPIGFVSRTLNAAERNYSQTEKEALSLVFGVNKFHYYIYGRPCTAYTDHKPLLGIFGKGIASRTASPRMVRWSLTLSAHDLTICYKPGKEHGNADALSRAPLAEEVKAKLPTETICAIKQLEETNISFKEIAKATAKDRVLRAIKHYVRTYWPNNIITELKPFFVKRDELSVQEDCLMWGSRVVIPEMLREKAMSMLHEDHQGCVKMKRTARGIMYWPKIDNDIEKCVESCADCQMNSNMPPKSLSVWEKAEKPWQRLHADYAGPFMGHYFLLIVDAYSKWLEVHKTNSMTSETTINLMRKTFATFGLPEQLHTDNGSCFTSNEFETFCKANGIKHTLSGAWHPETNGLAEKCVQIFKNAIKKMKGDMDFRLSRFLFRYRTTEQESTNRTPAFLLMGRELKTRLELMRPTVSINIRKDWKNEGKQRKFREGEDVIVRTDRNKEWTQGRIVSTLGFNNYEIALRNGNICRRHCDSLKPWKARSEEQNKQTFIEVPAQSSTETWHTEETDDSNNGNRTTSRNDEIESTADRASFVDRDSSFDHVSSFEQASSFVTSKKTSEACMSNQSESERRYPVRVREPPRYFIKDCVARS